MKWPPPGVWWAFSREPTFAWALSLKSNFTVSMRTLPPPENRREEWRLHRRIWGQKKQITRIILPLATTRYRMSEVRLLKSQTDFCLFSQSRILLVKMPSWQQAVRHYELFFWYLLAYQQGSSVQACHHSKEHVHTLSSDFNTLDASALAAIMCLWSCLRSVSDCLKMEGRMLWWNVINPSFVGTDLHIKLQVGLLKIVNKWAVGGAARP